MKRYKMLGLFGPFDGQDAAFDSRYDRRQLAKDLRAGRLHHHTANSAAGDADGAALNRHLAIYDLESDDPEADIAAMLAPQGTDAMPISPAINLDATTVLVYEEVGSQVGASSA